MLSLLALVIPLLSGVIALVVPWRRWIGWGSALSSAGVLGIGIALCISTSSHGAVSALHGTLRADALSSFMVVVIGSVSLLATLQTPRVMGQEIAEGRTTLGRRVTTSF